MYVITFRLAADVSDNMMLEVTERTLGLVAKSVSEKKLPFPLTSELPTVLETTQVTGRSQNTVDPTRLDSLLVGHYTKTAMVRRPLDLNSVFLNVIFPGDFSLEETVMFLEDVRSVLETGVWTTYLHTRVDPSVLEKFIHFYKYTGTGVTELMNRSVLTKLGSAVVESSVMTFQFKPSRAVHYGIALESTLSEFYPDETLAMVPTSATIH